MTYVYGKLIVFENKYYVIICALILIQMQHIFLKAEIYFAAYF